MKAGEYPERGPVPGDAAACVMLVTALAALGMSNEWTHWPLFVPFFVATAWQPVLAARIKVRLGLIGYLLLSGPFAFLFNAWEAESRTGFNYNTVFYLALYLAAYALVKLYSAPDASRRSHVLFCATMILAAGCDLPELHYGLLLAIFAPAAMYLQRCDLAATEGTARARHRRAMVVTFCFLLAAGVTAFTFRPIREAYSILERQMLRQLVMQLQLNPAVGFSDSAQLGDVSERRLGASAQAVAIQAFSEQAPGYLRGKAFLNYGDGIWTQLGGTRDETVEHLTGVKSKMGTYQLPGRPKPDPAAVPEMMLYPANELKAHFFMPLAASAIETACKVVSVDAGNSVQAKNSPSSRGYGVYLDPAPVRPAGDQESERPAGFLAIPPAATMRSALDRVLAQLPPESRADPNMAVNALADYFTRHYTYKLGIQFAPGIDPLWQFLVNKRHGHCELFASAGVLLLRRLGIPARYVAGFVCEERSPHGSVWFARNRHAHAWVEYYSAPAGWRTAEFTPAAGRPEVGGSDSGWSDYLYAWFSRLKNTLLREGITGLVNQVLGLIAAGGRWLMETWWRMLAVGLLLLVYFSRMFIRARRAARAAVGRLRPFPADLQDLRQEFQAGQRRLKPEELRRREAETLGEYARRLEAAPEAPLVAEAAELARRLDAARYLPFE